MRQFLISSILASLFFLASTESVQGVESAILYDTLKNGQGIRALSMGGAFTAIAEETAAIHYNPAGLASPGSLYSYEDMDTNDDLLKINQSHSIYLSPFAFSTLTRKDWVGNSVELFQYGFGRRSNRPINWGITYKTIKVEEQTFSQSGWTADLGILARMTPYMNVGLTLKDAARHDIDIPSTLAGGVAFFTPKRQLVLASDVYQYRKNGDDTVKTRVGLEYNLADGLIVRGGWNDGAWTSGVSLMMGAFDLQYGVVSPQDSSKEQYSMFGISVGRGSNSNAARRHYSLFKPKAFATFALGGNLKSGQSEISLLGGQKIGSNDLLTLIHHAANDSTCEGFLIRIGSLSSALSGVGMVQEIRQELIQAKRNGKKIYVYLNGWATLPEYYLASIADKIIMPELGTISHLGLELTITKTKAFLSNWGINSNVITSGIYKGSLNSQTDELNKEQRFMLENLVGSLYHQVLFQIKDGRKLDWTALSDVFDGRLVNAQEALKLGLVDKLGYWDDMEEFIKKDLKISQLAQEELDEFYDPGAPISIFSAFNRIAVIEVDGEISQGGNRQNVLFGGVSTGSDEIVAVLEHIKKDISIRAVILRVNSPGGSILASDQIYTAIKRFRESGKKVYVSMGSMAASGGYYVALGADKIMANAGTLTGSIGVISHHQNFEELYKMLDIHTDVIKTGKYADLFSKDRKITADELNMIQAYQKFHYDFFVNRVKENRQLTDAEVKEIAQGQVFTGKEAKDLKLIDGIGGFYDTVDALAKDSHISSPKLVFYRPDRSGLLSFLSFLGI